MVIVVRRSTSTFYYIHILSSCRGGVDRFAVVLDDDSSIALVRGINWKVPDSRESAATSRLRSTTEDPNFRRAQPPVVHL